MGYGFVLSCNLHCFLLEKHQVKSFIAFFHCRKQSKQAHCISFCLLEKWKMPWTLMSL